MNTELKKLNFFLVLCKTRKKLDKYMKINRIRNKYIIDIKKLLEEIEITNFEEAKDSDLLKIHIFQKITLAKEKKKDIYFIPHQESISNNKIFNLKQLLEDTHNFNLLYFYDDITGGDNIINNLQEFDLTQILKDY